MYLLDSLQCLVALLLQLRNLGQGGLELRIVLCGGIIVLVVVLGNLLLRFLQRLSQPLHLRLQLCVLRLGRPQFLRLGLDERLHLALPLFVEGPFVRQRLLASLDALDGLLLELFEAGLELLFEGGGVLELLLGSSEFFLEGSVVGSVVGSSGRRALGHGGWRVHGQQVHIPAASCRRCSFGCIYRRSGLCGTAEHVEQIRRWRRRRRRFARRRQVRHIARLASLLRSRTGTGSGGRSCAVVVRHCRAGFVADRRRRLGRCCPWHVGGTLRRRCTGGILASVLHGLLRLSAAMLVSRLTYLASTVLCPNAGLGKGAHAPFSCRRLVESSKSRVLMKKQASLVISFLFCLKRLGAPLD